jgi:hypothetical protein
MPPWHSSNARVEDEIVDVARRSRLRDKPVPDHAASPAVFGRREAPKDPLSAGAYLGVERRSQTDEPSPPFDRG